MRGREHTLPAVSIDFCGIRAVEGEFLLVRRIIVGILEVVGGLSVLV